MFPYTCKDSHQSRQNNTNIRSLKLYGRGGWYHILGGDIYHGSIKKTKKGYSTQNIILGVSSMHHCLPQCLFWYQQVSQCPKLEWFISCTAVTVITHYFPVCTLNCCAFVFQSNFNEKDAFYIFNHVDITIHYHIVEHEQLGARLVAAKIEPKR